MSAAVPMISMRGVGASFGAQRVLHGVDLDVERGEVLVLIGPSGSGKTTLLRCMNFLTPHDTGEVRILGASLGYDLAADGRRVPQSERAIAEVRAPLAMVFQQFNLWPHMTALRNVMAPLTIAGRLPTERALAMSLEALDRVGLASKAHLYPAALSGGQQQRVGIARALAGRPEAMLLDEPTSALDPELVGEVLDVIRALSRDGMTMVMVTHEMGFAAQVASRVVFMEQGGIVTQGPPDELMLQPTHARVRAFLQPWKDRHADFSAGAIA